MSKIFITALTALIPFALQAQQTLVLRDGTQLTGSMTGANQDSVTFRDRSGANRRYNVDQIDSLRFDGGYRRGAEDRNAAAFNAPPSNDPAYRSNSTYPGGPPPPTGSFSGNGQGTFAPGSDSAGRGYQTNGRLGNPMRLGAGTEIAVRTNENISSSDSNDSRLYAAQVSEDVLDDNGHVVIPRGSEAQLVIRRLANNNFALDLQSVLVNGNRFAVDTSGVAQEGTQREGVGGNRRTAEFVGGGALLGTLLGAIAGGGKGAAIGALAGGAAGAGTQVLTRGGQVKVPAETELRFRLDNPMRLRY